MVRAEPDGYTILANSSAHTIAPWIVPNIPYDTAKDLAGALMIGQNANVLIVSPAKGWKTVEDFVAYAKAHRGSVNYGSAGVGTATHMSAERFRLSAGFDAVHIPYKGGAEALTDVLGGRVDFYFCPISTALPFIREGRVLALVVSTPTRMPDLPDVPTSLEAGYRDSDTTIWYGVFMPAKTPRAIVDKFHAAGTKLLASPQMQDRLKQLAVYPMPLTPAGIDKLVADEIVANGKLIKAVGRAVSRRLDDAPRRYGRMEWTSGRSPTSSRSRRRSGASDIAAVVAAGFRSVICNRPDGESSDQPCCGDIEAVVKAHGLVWRSQPVRSGAVTIADARSSGAARRVAEAGARLLPVGTRCATLWSLSEAGKRPLAEIVSRANAAGLRRRLGDGTHPRSGGVRRA